jgi:hypothetical protein
MSLREALSVRADRRGGSKTRPYSVLQRHFPKLRFSSSEYSMGAAWLA